MASSNEVLLVRHGETDDTAVDRFQGRRDTPLNERGRQQAREVAIGLAGEDGDRPDRRVRVAGTDLRSMCSSSRSRARETAARRSPAADIA